MIRSVNKSGVRMLELMLLVILVWLLVAFSPPFIQSAYAEWVEGPLRADPRAYEHIDEEGLSAQSMEDSFDGTVIAQATGTTNAVSLSLSLDQMIQMCMKDNRYNHSYAQFQAGLDPNSCNLTVFADLRTSSGLTATQIDAFIDSVPKARTGKLHGMGYAFIKAQETYHVNAAYLVAHAILETGWGTSQLASGSLGIYNFFGIGAYDGDPVNAGVSMAGRYGWTTPEGAILGGASWIAKHYIYASKYTQPTLYAMKWDYARANAENSCWHQYCTGVSWHEQIADIMNRAYSSAGIEPVYNYIIPQYKGLSVPDTNARSVYRLYNSATMEHLYTTDWNERITLEKGGWQYEGVGWSSPKESRVPVFRICDVRSGEHLYTADAHERDVRVGEGWRDEGIAWYSSENGGVAVRRHYNPAAGLGSHHYTSDTVESQHLINKAGWKDENIAWYGL